MLSFRFRSDNIARLPLPARHSPEAKPMADGQGTSGQALYKIVARFYSLNILAANSMSSGQKTNRHFSSGDETEP